MNGLNRSPSASSNERPGGLAQASHAAASMVAMDGTTRAVKLEDMGGQAVRSGGIAHLSTHGAVFVVKASSLALVRIVPSRDRGSHWDLQVAQGIVAWNGAREKRFTADARDPASRRSRQDRRFNSSA
jgi:hypothetical protein